MQNLFVIIEGPDNVGKSTLIQNLKNSLNDMVFHVLHCSNVKQKNQDAIIKYNKNLYFQMLDLMFHMSTKPSTGMICDRSHLGEMVYGPIYRGYSGDYVLDIENSFRHIGPVFDNLFLVTLIDEPENLITREDGLSFSTDLQKKQREIDLFKNAHEKSGIKYKLLLNIKDHNEEQALHAVLKFIKEKK